MKGRFIVLISSLFASIASSGACTWAQNAQKAHWPPLPRLAVRPGSTPKNNGLLRKDGTSYYNFTEVRHSPLPPERLYFPPALDAFKSQMGEGAFQLLAPSQVGRTFLFSPGRSDQNGNTYGIFNLKKVPASQKRVSSQIFYIANDTIGFFHSPLFSPNGQKVIIRDGYPPDDRYSGYNLFLWEVQTGKLRYIMHGAADLSRTIPRGNDSIMLPSLKWSPGSRYVSYMRYGNAFGDYDARTEPYVLYCMDTATLLDHRVMQSAGLHWSWTYRGQILCSLVPPKYQYKVSERIARPSVYTVNAKGGKPFKLFDGGYYAQESPDGEWIAFCDWPGALFDATAPAPELVGQKKKGLFLFSRKTKKRIFVGPLALESTSWPADAPLLQWSPDGRTLFVLDSMRQGVQLTGTIYRMVLGENKLRSLASVVRTPTGGYGFFRPRGISSDGKTLYYEAREGIQGPPNVPSQEFTILAIDTKTGGVTPLARLINIANENPDWDFRDDLGLSPALVQSQKVEDASLK